MKTGLGVLLSGGAVAREKQGWVRTPAQVQLNIKAPLRTEQDHHRFEEETYWELGCLGLDLLIPRFMALDESQDPSAE